jgi:hypothetical protein
MKAPVRNFIIRDATGTREAETLVIGRGIPLSTTAGGLPELESLLPGQGQLMPSGGDDTQAIRDALARFGGVRLGPGEFHASGTIAVGAGQSVVGCGPERTTLRFVHPGPLFGLAGSGAAVEEMSIVGPGEYYIGSVGVHTASATDVRLRGLSIREADRGIDLAGVSRVEISRVALRYMGTNALLVAGPGGQVSITGVLVEEAGNSALLLSSLDGVHCACVTIRECLRGILVSQGKAHAFSSVHAYNAPLAFSVQGTHGLSIVGLHLLECSTGLVLTNASGVQVDGCTFELEGGTPLRISGGQAISLSGIRSQTSGSSAHLVVLGGATEVTVTGIHRVNPATPPTYEVDVSAAGGRVVFIQHNFDPARINSGGNFAAL